MKNYAVFLLVLVLYPFCLIDGQTKPQKQQDSVISRLWMYYTTPDKQTHINDIAKNYLSGKFKPVDEAILNPGIPKQYYWIHFTLTNKRSEPYDLVIHFENARLNEIELFEQSNGTIKSLGKLGDFYPFSVRLILHKDLIYRVFIAPLQNKDFFLYVNQVGHTFTLPVKVYSAKNFSSLAFKDYLFNGVTYGILLFVAIVSFLFFLTSKHYLYLYYSMYILTAIIWLLSYFGLGYQYIWGNNPAINTSMAPAMASLNILINVQICQVLLRMEKTKRMLNRIANFTKLALFALAIIPVFINLNNYGYTINHTYLILFLFTILFAMMIVSFSVILYSVKGLIAARLYLVASLLKAVSIINLALLELGITPAVHNMEVYLQIGIFIEITLLTYALSLRYTTFKARTFVRVIEAHENERSLISKEIHDSISNSLTGINYGIENLTRNLEYLPVEKRIHLNIIYNELIKVQSEARSISHNTMPEYIKNSSVTEIVEKYVQEIENRMKINLEEKINIQINFSSNQQPNVFSEAVKLNIFRIIQEILTNILKHSKATNADILFSFSKKEMTIIVEDNGIGFGSTSREKNKVNGMGVKNMRTRVELLDGTFAIKSPVIKQNTEQVMQSGSSSLLPEYGTMIKIKIPYRNNLFKNKTGYEY